MAKQVRRPDFPMTKKQGYAIFLMSGVDVRPMQLTCGQASEMIKMLLDNKQAKADKADMIVKHIKSSDISQVAPSN